MSKRYPASSGLCAEHVPAKHVGMHVNAHSQTLVIQFPTRTLLADAMTPTFLVISVIAP